MTRIAINGFGPIGRNVLRALLERDSDLAVVAVNDLTESATLARLRLLHDGGPARPSGDRRRGRPRRRRPSHHRARRARTGAAAVGRPRRRYRAGATGRFTSATAARAHLDAGARRVLISAPADGADVTLAFGVNTAAYDPAAHTIVSNASCTTNARAPLAAALVVLR